MLSAPHILTSSGLDWLTGQRCNSLNDQGLNRVLDKGLFPLFRVVVREHGNARLDEMRGAAKGPEEDSVRIG